MRHVATLRLLLLCGKRDCTTQPVTPADVAAAILL